jgi:hypothetical protein
MGTSSVNFMNNTSSPVNVAYMRRNASNCSDRCGSVWEVLGWLVLAPGKGLKGSNPDRNRWFYFYAESATRVWNGDYSGEVQSPRFTECRGCILYQIQQNGEAESFPISPWHLVGFAALDTNTFGGVDLIE